MIDFIKDLLNSQILRQILSIALPILSIYQAYIWHKKTRWLRLLRDTPTSRIQSAAQGQVELVGHAHFLNDSPIVSPLTGRSCVWFHYRIEEYDPGDEDETGGWETIERVTSPHLFMIKDETGQCVIDPDDALVKPFQSQRWYQSEHFHGKLPSESKKRMIVSSRERYRYYEEWIEEDEPLFAVGDFKTHGTGSDMTSINDEVNELLKLWKSNPEHYLKPLGIDSLFNITEKQWESVRAAAKIQVQKEQHSRPDPVSAHLLGKPKHIRDGFLISSLSEEELIQYFKKKSIFSLVICIISGTFGFPLLIAWILSGTFF